MFRPRHLIMSATLAVAFLSAGAFAQDEGAATASVAQAPAANITVIAKTSDFAS